MGPRQTWALDSIPVFIAITLILGVLIAIALDKGKLMERYVTHGHRSLATGDFARARLDFERALQLESHDPEIVLGLAKAEFGLGNWERGIRLLDDVAPPEIQGPNEAHLLKAKELLARSQTSEADFALIQKHLMRSLDGNKSNVEAQILLGRLYATKKDIEKAETHLKEAMQENPAAGTWLARFYLENKKTEEAKETLNKVREWATKYLAQNTRSVPARLTLAEILRVEGNYAEAIKTLEMGITSHPEERSYKEARAMIVLSWIDRAITQKENLPVVLTLLVEELRTRPNDTRLIDRLAPILNWGDSESDSLRTKLQDLVAHGKAGPALLFALGTDAFERKKLEEARTLWEQSYTLDPTIPALMNNLAWYWLKAKTPDLNRALGFIETAVASQPHNPAFRSTRGLIYAGLDRGKDALVDLQIALTRYPNDREVHAAMAKIYREMGAGEMAEAHERFLGTKREVANEK